MPVRDFALDENDDIFLENGNIAMVGAHAGSTSTDPDAIKQAVRGRLLLVLGEWFTDLEDGTDWFGAILVKNPQLPVVQAILQKRILDTPGVSTLVSFSTVVDASTRELRVSYSATLDTGELINDSLAKDSP